MTTPHIMAYVAPAGDLVHGVSTNGALPDFVNTLLYIFGYGAGMSANSGLRKFQGYTGTDSTGGIEVLSKTKSQMGVEGLPPSNAFMLTLGNYLLWPASASNSPLVTEVASASLAQISTFSADTNSTAMSTATRICQPAQFQQVRHSGQDFIVSASLYSTQPGEINVLTTPSMTNTRAGATASAAPLIGPGPDNVAYVLDFPKPSLLPTTTASTLYSLTASTAVLASIGTVSPAQVDATWTHFSNLVGLAYDVQNGFVLCQFQTSDAVTNKQYIVALNSSTAAVAWKVVISGLDANGMISMPNSSIKNGTYYYMDGTNLLTITTATGATVTTAIGTLQFTGAQFSEDTSGSVIGYGSWSETTTHPVYNGNYMGTLANHSVSGQWIQYWPGTPTNPPPPTPPTPAPVISTRRAWTYVMDGHQFYVIDLGAQGTFAYDMTTKEWTNFVTNYNGNTNWNMQAGVMWGQRVVACDILTSDVWEMVPGTLTDNGAQLIDIQHIVTGGLVSRTRTYKSVANLRLSVSAGFLTESAGGTMTLEMSDDRGNTWTATRAPDSGALVENQFTQEVVWRSCGAFAAPGRIFRITDTGGFLAIEGCDADMEDFDDEAEPEKQQ